MARFPEYPQKGEAILEWAEQVQEWLRDRRMTGAVDAKHPLRNSYRKRFPFQVEPLSASTVRVRCGTWTRMAGGTRYEVAPAAGSTQDDTSDVTLIAGGTNYIIASISPVAAPTLLTLSATLTKPADTNYSTKILYECDVSGGGEMTGPGRQKWFGGNIQDLYGGGLEVDGLSLDLNGTGSDEDAQIYNWDNAASVAWGSNLMDSSALMIWQDVTDSRAAKYADADVVSEWLINHGSSFVTTWQGLYDTDNTTAGGDPTDSGNVGKIPIVTDYGSSIYALKLTDLTATGVGPFWVKGAAAADCYGESIGNDSAQVTIDLDNQALETNGTENLTWDSTSVDISSGPVFKVLNSTAAGYQSGALQCSGGGFFQNGIYSVPAPASVDAGVFTDETVDVNIVHHSGNYAIEANHGVATAVTICDSTNAVDATTGAINANSSSGFTVGGTQVVLDQQSTTGQTAGFTAGSGTGVNDDSTFTGGSGTKAYTIGDIVKHLKYHGLIASS